MRVFVTGAAGWVGSAVVKELLARGHQPIGLARSDANAAAITAAGAAVHRGSLEDVDSLVAGAKAADGVVHCAFNHDFTKFVANCEMDLRAIKAMGGALEGTEKPMLISSGVGVLRGVEAVDEDVWPKPSPEAFPRIYSELEVKALAERGVRISIVRLPPTTHGVGDRGFVPQLVSIARAKGIAAYVEAGDNLWPAVHRFDAAKVYCLALEKGAAGARYHAIAEEGIPFREIATAIGKGLGVQTVSLTKADAAGYFGGFAHFAAIGVRGLSAKTRQSLGWTPTEPDLLADLSGPSYFQADLGSSGKSGKGLLYSTRLRALNPEYGEKHGETLALQSYDAHRRCGRARKTDHVHRGQTDGGPARRHPQRRLCRYVLHDGTRRKCSAAR